MKNSGKSLLEITLELFPDLEGADPNYNPVACSPKTGAWEMLESPERKEIRDEEEAVFGRANYQDFTASRAG
jgi:hypothetical protein